MIESKEQYDLIRNIPLGAPPGGIAEHNDIIETIEALREVARAARLTAADFGNMYREFNLPMGEEEIRLARLRQKSSALPDWIFDES